MYELFMAIINNWHEALWLGGVISAVVIFWYQTKGLGCKIDRNADASKKAHSELKDDMLNLAKTTAKQGEDISYIRGRLDERDK